MKTLISVPSRLMTERWTAGTHVRTFMCAGPVWKVNESCCTLYEAEKNKKSRYGYSFCTTMVHEFTWQLQAVLSRHILFNEALFLYGTSVRQGRTNRRDSCSEMIPDKYGFHIRTYSTSCQARCHLPRYVRRKFIFGVRLFSHQPFSRTRTIKLLKCSLERMEKDAGRSGSIFYGIILHANWMEGVQKVPDEYLGRRNFSTVRAVHTCVPTVLS